MTDSPDHNAKFTNQRHLGSSDLLRMWMEKEAATGFSALRISRADGEPDCIEGLDAPPRKDGDQIARHGGWRLDQIEVRFAHFGRGFGHAFMKVERLEQRLLELGWVKKQVRVGQRALNQREPRWFLDQAVRQRLMSSDGRTRARRTAMPATPMPPTTTTTTPPPSRNISMSTTHGTSAIADFDTPYQHLVRSWTAWADRQNVRPDANCGWLRDGVMSDADTDQLRVEFVHQHQLSHARLQNDDVNNCVEATVRGWREQRKIMILTGILWGPSTDEGRAALRALIRAWTGAEDPLHVAALAHFVWQVKRRAIGMDVEYDLMPVLVGPQGSGKVTAIERLCSVLAELSVPVTAVQIVGQREAPLMARALVGRWDEMSVASRADGKAIKRAISQVQSAFRHIYSNDFDVRRRTITFIGASGSHLSEILNDTSVAQRFVEIIVNRVDWEAADKVDVRKVWNSVSEQDPAPILDYRFALPNSRP